MVTAIVLIQTERQRHAEAAEALLEIDEVKEVYSVAGDWDLGLRLHDELEPEQLLAYAKIETQVASTCILSLQGMNEQAERRLDLARRQPAHG